MTKKNVRRILFVVLAIVCISLTLHINGALASDIPSDTDACENFPHQWGDNIICEGKFTRADMGAFDTNGVWQWDTDFENLLTHFNFSPWNPHEAGAWEAIAVHPNTKTVVDWWRVDNKRYPNGDLKHRVAGVEGYTGGIMFPIIWKSRVEDPIGFDPEDDIWTSHFTSYPYYITHIDMAMVDQCEALCNDGCQFDDGPITLPGGYICSWDDNGTYPLFENAMFEVEGEERLTPDNVEKIVLNGVEEYPSYIEHGTFYSMSYNTGNNSQKGSNSPNEYTDLYFHHYDGLLPMNGPQIAVLHMKNEDTVDLTYEVKSDRVLPTVAATYEYQVERVNKSGRHTLTGQTVTAPNMSARELDGQLIIQWNEPDGAFQAPLPNTGGIRLRLWVGDMSNTDNLQFLWIDAPVMTGTIVVPADKWSMIRDRMIAIHRTSVDIGGMYREQFSTFHNRGYFESIEYTF